jgi:hypothetical protein
METQNNMTLDEAIAHAKEVAAFKCDECGKEHQQLAEWLQELAGFKDKTPITNEFLEIIGFKREKIIDPYHKGEISIQKMCGGIGDWTWECVYFKGKSWTSDLVDTVFIKTIGELRMFLTICGLGDFVKQLKN